VVNVAGNWVFAFLERLASSVDSVRCVMYLVVMRNDKTYRLDDEALKRLRAVASPVRLAILDDLKSPENRFPPQVDGDFKIDGVCADFIRNRLGLAAATTSRHLTLLVDAGFVLATRKKGWTFYRRNEEAIDRFIKRLASNL
jgi:DNA-binding transcriptional ArsR family regulator